MCSGDNPTYNYSLFLTLCQVNLEIFLDYFFISKLFVPYRYT